MEKFPYSKLDESQLMNLLQDSLRDSSKELQTKRISSLEEILRRARSGLFENLGNFAKISLDTAVKYGHDQPESALIIDILVTAVDNNEEILETIIEYADRLVASESRLFLVFAELVLKFDHKKQQQTIKTLVKFLVKSDILNRTGVAEVYNCLVQLGNQKLGSKIAEEAALFLDSLETCSIIFSVRLCSEFAGKDHIEEMIGVLEKSMKGYYKDHHVELERRICKYLKRIKDPASLPHLTSLLKLRYQENPSDKSDAIGEILNSYPHLIDDVLDMLYDARRNKELVTAILHSFENMEKPPSATKLLSKIHIKYWWENPARFYVKNILVKGGESSKPILFEILEDDEKYDFALESLKEIGVSAEELSRVFSEPPMLQIYKFLCSQARSSKLPKDLDTLWLEKEKLGENVPGKTDRLEHLLLHIFCSFNFVTLNVAPLKLQSIDIVCFYPETLDLLIIGCTTGVLKDDLAKMDALVNKMRTKISDLFDFCTVTPVTVCSESAAISPTDLKYAKEQGISIMQDHDIDKLLEMLKTNRDPKDVLKYIEEQKWLFTDSVGNY